MKLSAVTLDDDGTIAIGGAFDPGVRDAISQLRLHGIAVVLVTGPRLAEFKSVGRHPRMLQCDRRRAGAARARELTQALRYPDTSVVSDLSKLHATAPDPSST